VWPTQTKRIDASAYPVYRPLNNEQFAENHIIANWVASDALTIKSITAYRNDASFDYNTASTSSTLPGVFIGRPDLAWSPPHGDLRHPAQAVLAGVPVHRNTEASAMVGGLFFMNERGTQIDNTYFGLAFPNATFTGVYAPFAGASSPLSERWANRLVLDPALALGSASESGGSVQNISAAGFGQVTWRPEWLDDKLALTGGLRLGVDEKKVVRPSGFIWDQVTYPATQGASAPTPPPSRTGLPLLATFDHTAARPALASFRTTGPTTSRLTSATLPVTALLLSPWHRKPSTRRGRIRRRPTSSAKNPNSSTSCARQRRGVLHPLEKSSTERADRQHFHGGIFQRSTIQIRGVEIDSSFVPLDGLTISVNGTYYHGREATVGNPFAQPDRPASRDSRTR